MAESIKPAKRQEIPGALGSDELRAYIGVGLAINYVNVVINSSGRFSGVIPLEDTISLIKDAMKADPDYGSLERRLDDMVEKGYDESGIKITLAGSLIKQAQDLFVKWAGTIGDIANKVKSLKDAKTEYASIADMLADDNYMEQVDLILEDADQAMAANNFYQRLVATMAKYMDLLNCISKYQDGFRSYFMNVLDNVDTSMAKDPPPINPNPKRTPIPPTAEEKKAAEDRERRRKAHSGGRRRR